MRTRIEVYDFLTSSEGPDCVKEGFRDIVDGAVENGIVEPLLDWCLERAPEPWDRTFSDPVWFVGEMPRIALTEGNLKAK